MTSRIFPLGRAFAVGALLIATSTSLIVVGCTRDEPMAPDGQVDGASFNALAKPPPPTNPADGFNLQLRQKINQVGGFAFFRQPDSDDFASIPQDPLNPITTAKVELGRLLFNEVGLAGNNVRPEGEKTYTCATCHPNNASYFSALPQAIAEGGSGFGVAGEGRVLLAAYDSAPDTPDVQTVRAPSIINMAFQQLAMRDGRLGGVGQNLAIMGQWNPSDGSDNNSLGHHGIETQAFAALAEHRMGDVDSSDVAGNPTYQAMFAAAFPGDPTVNRYNAAMALAAFERTVMTQEAPFQRFLRGYRYAMTVEQLRGALLFFGKAQCSTCHTGPALNSMTFWAIGMNDLDASADPSRVDLTPFGETIPASKRLGRGGFSGQSFEEYAFKTPQLYNLKDSQYYGHGSSFSSIRDVVVYYNNGGKQNVNVPQAKITPLFQPLGLTNAEINDLTEFLENGLYDPNMSRHSPPSTPIGLCYPANDPQAQIDIGCAGAASTAESHRADDHGRGSSR